MALYNQNLVELQALSSFDNVSTNSYTIQPVAAITCSVYIIQLMICMNKHALQQKQQKTPPKTFKGRKSSWFLLLPSYWAFYREHVMLY